MTLDAQERARLLPSYLATTYRAATPAGPIDLRIGQLSPALDELLESLGAGTWAFISAANPRSRALSEPENAARHGSLRALAEQRGLRHFEGEGIPDEAGWVAEPSLLIPGLPLDQALELAACFGQNAIVWGERGTPAHLAWCKPDEGACGPVAIAVAGSAGPLAGNDSLC